MRIRTEEKELSVWKSNRFIKLQFQYNEKNQRIKYAKKMTVNSNMQQQQKSSEMSQSVALATSRNFNISCVRWLLVHHHRLQLPRSN